MKIKFLSVILALLIPYPLLSNNVQERNLPQFDKLKVTNEIVVYLQKGEKEVARVDARGIALDNIITEVKGKILEITLARGVYRDARVEVHLTYTQIKEISVSGSGTVSLQNTIVGDKLTLYATTNGVIDADVELSSLDITARKAATVMLRGTVGNIDATVSTGASLSSFKLQSDSTFVRVTSKGIAKVTSSALLDATVRSGGSLTYIGNPPSKTIKSGFGTTVIKQE